jgi:hypothetical protein
MAVPKTHKTGLERNLKAHAREVTGLRAILKKLDAELKRREDGKWSDPNPKPEGIPGLRIERDLIELQIDRHLALVDLARDERLLAMLDELDDNPEVVEKAARDPRAFAKARGVSLPKTMDLEVGQVHGKLRVRVVNYDAQTPFTLVWDRRGFSFAE